MLTLVVAIDSPKPLALATQLRELSLELLDYGQFYAVNPFHRCQHLGVMSHQLVFHGPSMPLRTPHNRYDTLVLHVLREVRMRVNRMANAAMDVQNEPG